MTTRAKNKPAAAPIVDAAPIVETPIAAETIQPVETEVPTVAAVEPASAPIEETEGHAAEAAPVEPVVEAIVPEASADPNPDAEQSVSAEDAPVRWLKFLTSLSGPGFSVSRNDKAPVCDRAGPNGEPSEAQRLIDAGFAVAAAAEA